MWDVIVVGARVAGAATALRFARSGRSVLVVDKARAGSDTLSTHYLAAPTIAHLDALGVLEAVGATGAPRLHSFVVAFGGAVYRLPDASPHGFTLAVRRTILDPILVDAAEQAGACVRYETRVETLLWDNDRVVGVRVRDRSGAAITERARLVVGADGRHSLVAQQVEAALYHVQESPSAALYAYLRGVGPSVAGADAVHLAAGPACQALWFPCDGGLHVVLLGVSPEEFGELSTRGPEAYDARLRTIPALAPRLAEAERASGVYRAHPRELRGYFRQPFGPGWALAGDAGYNAHPAAPNGIGDALRSAELVQALVERAWAEEQPAETYLDEYQRTRDRENIEPFFLSYRLGQANAFDDPAVVAGFTHAAQQAGSGQ
jgi:flavin-dependent dehydrogenase